MNKFKSRFLLSITYYFLWVIYFLFARFLFLVYYYEKTSELSFFTTLKTFVYGIKLDFSFAAYLAAIPFFIILFSIWIPKKITSYLIKGYTFPIILIVNLFMLTDIALYKFWGVRIDVTVLNYINTPKAMLASVSTLQLVGGIIIWVLLSTATIYFFNKVLNKAFSKVVNGHFVEAPVFLLLIGSLIVPIRGGFANIPINQSNVYFSTNMFANHSAVNFIWNFANTISHKTDGKNPYIHYKPDVAQNIINKTKNQLLTASTDSILNTQKPNIILIIWESLSAKAVGVLGGESDVTSNLNKLAKQGILFTNFYSNGDRTDKGIPAILSGYYPQPTNSIMKIPYKARKLPMLTTEMKKLGYNTSFYYGGDSNFGNMITYLRNGQIDKIVDGTEFDKENWNSKWGAHDHIFLDRFMEDLSNPTLKEPFFEIALTLTSHEPYEFPDEYKFGKSSVENLYKSAQAYTDKAIGKFINEAKKQSWWDNTLIIILSDHGHPLPKHKGYFNSPIRFQIPMVWLGGALNKTGVTIDNFSAQSDLAYTLTDMLGGNPEQFQFGKNIFNTSENQYAHYIFNKGFGTISKNGTFVFDYVSNKPVIKEGNYKPLDSLGRAISQDAYQDFLDK
ncbi:phosphoglycerol transferase MdoB-like AlkP superfamily enzyme [Tenacibaculum lutimaris]|uniref:Phosphoglycerol transferase MdoB-like AlkP superfamily enzyme n=1 Tax=Tenacibaculum lutimaris TaxID=285258 RepID=A0A420DYV6_9FLAO|nr:alkaline phosphatase family protein [Tenacibaculum lutimaris]RKF02998.1 phosphoglycerol transferase MdoB-like AlkP superfamily enzyme [Tenacibaculum lutimaris]